MRRVLLAIVCLLATLVLASVGTSRPVSAQLDDEAVWETPPELCYTAIVPSMRHAQFCIGGFQYLERYGGGSNSVPRVVQMYGAWGFPLKCKCSDK